MIKSSFFEFNVAISALSTSQSNMQITSHNIANANTKGYSRQYGIQSAKKPMTYLDGRGMYGAGSVLNGIGQIRNPHLDTKFWSRNTSLGQHTVKSTKMATVESTFNELGDGTGVLGSLDSLFSALQEVGVDSSDLTIRNGFITQGESFTKLVNNIGSQLEKQQYEINQEVRMTVDRINSIGNQIATLNQQINYYEASGDKANDLRDARAVLVDELSTYVNVDVTEVEMNKDYDPSDISTGVSNKLFSVQINGYDFIKGKRCNNLECVERKVGEEKNPNDVPRLYDIKFANSGVPFNIYSSTLEGSLKGLIDVRDGNNSKHAISPNNYGESFDETVSYKGIPHFQDKLNSLIRVLSRAMNEGVDYNGDPLDGITGHQNGYDQNGDTGNVLFTFTDDTGFTLNNVTDDTIDYSKMNYNNFTINTDMLRDPSLIATTIDSTTGESDNNLILGLVDLQKNAQLFAEGSVEDFVNGISIEIGISVDQATKFERVYTDTVTLIDNQRRSVSGVDLNEEMIIMVQYQQQYNAAAKLINTIDNIYNTLINSVGV